MKAKISTKIFNTAYSKKRRVYAPDNGDPSHAKQSFRDECDINKIMASYQKTGAVTHFAKHQPSYQICSGQSFHEAMNLCLDAQTMFDDLPATLRSKFMNDPSQFLEFVQNPDNAAEMIELGLSNAKPQPPAEIVPEAPSDPPKPPPE